jgi:hypothetical protein
MTAIKLNHNGAWQISALIDNYLVTRTYYGYTKREAIAQFKCDFM